MRSERVLHFVRESNMDTCIYFLFVFFRDVDEFEQPLRASPSICHVQKHPAVIPKQGKNPSSDAFETLRIMWKIDRFSRM